MKLSEIGQRILKQAEDKGWGHTKESLNVAEKTMLIATEITELREATTTVVSSPKDTIESETADILMRTLHLGTAWGIDFDSEEIFTSRFKDHEIKSITDDDYLYLYFLVTNAYDQYRHKEIDNFKMSLKIIALEVNYLAQDLDMDIATACLNKISINESRVWDKEKLNGNYYKGSQS